MNAGLIILRVASERRDAQNARDGARAAQLRRSSDSVAAATPSQQQLRASVLDAVKMFFSVFGQTPKHVFLLFFRGSVLFLPFRPGNIVRTFPRHIHIAMSLNLL